MTGVSQVGCSPNSLSQGSSDGTCVKNINDANEMFNTRLKALVDNLNREHPDAKFTYINSFGLFQELKDNAATYGTVHFLITHPNTIYRIFFFNRLAYSLINEYLF